MTAFVEHNLYRLFGFNSCITMNELRMRMRGARPFLVLLFYALIAAAAVLLALIPIVIERRYAFGPARLDAGRLLFAVLAHTQLTLVLLILPAYSAGAITMEREKRTLEMLRATLITPSDLITGKLLVILAFALVLLLTSLPVAAWCMLLGGIAPEELLYVYTFLLIVAAFVSTLGLFYSALLRRSMGAIVLTYGTIIVLSVFSSMVPGLYMMVSALMPGGRGTFGSLGATILLLVAGLISGPILFLAVRWILARLLPRRPVRFAALIGLAAVLAWLAFLLLPFLPIHSAVRSAPIPWLMITNPYVALGGIMSGDFAEAVVTSIGGGGVPANINVVIWSISALFLITVAAGLWALSIRIFRARA